VTLLAPVPTAAAARCCRFGEVPRRGWDGVRDRLIGDFLALLRVAVSPSPALPPFLVFVWWSCCEWPAVAVFRTAPPVAQRHSHLRPC